LRLTCINTDSDIIERFTKYTFTSEELERGGASILGESNSFYVNDNTGYRFSEKKTTILYSINNCNTKKRISGEGIWEAVIARK